MYIITEKDGKKGKSYLIQVKIKGFNGAEIQKARTWRPEFQLTPKQLEIAVNRVAKAYEEEICEQYAGKTKAVATDETFFNSFAEYWMSLMEKKISDSYYASLKNAFSIVAPLTEQYRLKDFTPTVIKNIFNQIDETKKEEHVIVAKEELNKLFKDRKIMKTCFCRSTGFASPTLRDVCSGNNVSHKTAEQLATLLGVDIEQIFDVKVKYVNFKSSYLEGIKKFLRCCLTGAVKLGVIEKNYSDRLYLTYKHPDADKVKSMTLDETKKLFNTAMQSAIPNRLAIVLLLVTGMRKGELCGLDWEDINFQKKTIKVQRSYSLVSGKGAILGAPKTKSSIREFEIPDLAVNLLQEYKHWYDECKSKKGSDWQGEDNIFIQRSGKRLHPTSIRNWLDECLEKAGLPHYPVHSLRHTNITLLIASGVSPVTVAYRVGHAKVSTTTDIYADILGESNRDASNRLNKIFSEM